MALAKIVSGGQTGVDRGALDAALNAGFPCGGWCPEGRKAEGGVIPERYPVQELPGAGYSKRTRRNVEDSDGTLILYFGEISGGTSFTLQVCNRFKKPVMSIDGAITSPQDAAAKVEEFVRDKRIATLNVAGPRAGSTPQAEHYAREAVAAALVLLSESAS